MKFKISKSKIEGKGLFCTEPIKAGELLFTSKGLRTLNKSTTIEDAQITHKHSISIDEKTIHCPLPDDPLRFLNHSCDCNCYVDHEHKFYAKRAIQPGEEITIDYSFVDADIYWRMIGCKCGHKKCRGLISSSLLLSRDFFEKNLPYIPKKIRRFNAKFYGIPFTKYEC